ncbi:hypothetical protein P20495_0467 [Pseudoalteromonas sp. BSi20495]|nr:hypothetical protein P20495_0467 [Pseudoalteromonas sp. BSi20495]
MTIFNAQYVILFCTLKLTIEIWVNCNFMLAYSDSLGYS